MDDDHERKPEPEEPERQYEEIDWGEEDDAAWQAVLEDEWRRQEVGLPDEPDEEDIVPIEDPGVTDEDIAALERAAAYVRRMKAELRAELEPGETLPEILENAEKDREE